MKHTAGTSLKNYNSFAVQAHAAKIITITSIAQLQQLVSQHAFDYQQDLILGGGSNILLARDIQGMVLLNRIEGKKIVQESQGEALVEVNAGENWHELVLWSLDQGLSGLENLSLIPGLVGAAPIQNIGAYGVELAQVLEDLEVLELVSGNLHKLSNQQCHFSYRNSRFKASDAGKYMVTCIRLKLQRKFKPVLRYQGLREELTAMGLAVPGQATARQVSDAVIRIRKRKLPDLATTANAGSFFKNPIVNQETAAELSQQFCDLPVYPGTNGQPRLGAAWMIEQCGWKGRSMGRAAVSAQHALVLINTGGATGQEILELAHAINTSVQDRFGIELQAEPHIFSENGLIAGDTHANY